MKLLGGGCRYLKLFPSSYEVNSVKIAGLFHLQTKIFSPPIHSVAIFFDKRSITP